MLSELDRREGDGASVGARKLAKNRFPIKGGKKSNTSEAGNGSDSSLGELVRRAFVAIYYVMKGGMIHRLYINIYYTICFLFYIVEHANIGRSAYITMK